MNQKRLKAARGLLLIVAALFVLGIANSPFAATYPALLHLEFGPAIPRGGVFSLHEWIPDGLIAIFFLLVGLEVKREWHEGDSVDGRGPAPIPECGLGRGRCSNRIHGIDGVARFPESRALQLEWGQAIRLPRESVVPISNGAVLGITEAELRQLVETVQAPKLSAGPTSARR